MRRAGVLADQSKAETFGDYLLTQGISCRIDEESDGWAIWIHDEEQFEQSRQYLEDFRSNPDASRFADCSQEAKKIRQAETQRNKEYTKNVVQVRSRWQGRHIGNFPVTKVLIGISILVTLVTNFGTDNKLSPYLYIASCHQVETPKGTAFQYKPSLTEIESGQIWRLVTPILMHDSVLHLIFNMYMLYQFGALLESRRGSWRFLSFVLIIAVFSNLCQYRYNSPAFLGMSGKVSPVFLGMSGVVYGLFGYAWMKSRFDPRAGFVLNQNTVFILMIWLFLCMTPMLPNIANTAHVTGLLAGIVLGYAPILWRNIRT